MYVLTVVSVQVRQTMYIAALTLGVFNDINAFVFVAFADVKWKTCSMHARVRRQREDALQPGNSAPSRSLVPVIVRSSSSSPSSFMIHQIRGVIPMPAPTSVSSAADS